MGKIFSNLGYKNDYKGVKLEFDTAIPTEEGKETYEMVVSVQKTASQLIDKLRIYEGCENEIREAFNNPDDMEILKKVFSVIGKRVIISNELYKFSTGLNTNFIAILKKFESLASDKSRPTLAKDQALVRKTVDLLATILALDEVKLSKPSLQNDLAFYRRMLPRLSDEELPISKEEVNTVISLLAEHMSVTVSLSRAVKKHAEQEQGVVQLLGETAMGLFNIVHTRTLSKDEEIIFMKASVLCIIIYDAVYEPGIVKKTSEVNLRYIAKFLSQNNGKVGHANDMRKMADYIKYGCKSDSFRTSSIIDLLEF